MVATPRLHCLKKSPVAPDTFPTKIHYTVHLIMATSKHVGYSYMFKYFFFCCFVTGMMEAIWQQEMEGSGDVSLDSEMPKVRVVIHQKFFLSLAELSSTFFYTEGWAHRLQWREGI